MSLGVEHEPLLVDAAVEMDRQLGDARDRIADVDQRVRTIREHDPTGDAEVAIEPRVVEDPPVDLDGELTPPTDARRIRARLDTEHR